MQHYGLFPVDVNRAPFEMLLRVPGIGPKAPGASGAPARINFTQTQSLASCMNYLFADLSALELFFVIFHHV